MVGVAWFYLKNKGNECCPFLFIKTTPTITLSGIIRLGGGSLYYLYYPTAAQREFCLEPRAF